MESDCQEVMTMEGHLAAESQPKLSRVNLPAVAGKNVTEKLSGLDANAGT